jgi:hypothetical protein
MEIRSITKEELTKYEHRKGFVFTAGSPSSDSSIKNLCHVLIARNITKTMPEFIGRIDNSTVFVYGDDFFGPAFFGGAGLAEQMGLCKIESFSELLARI